MNPSPPESARLIKQIALDMVLEKKEKRSKGEASGLDILSVAMDSGKRRFPQKVSHLEVNLAQHISKLTVATGNFSDENLVNQLMTFLAAVCVLV